MTFPELPICAVCRRPVARLVTWEDMFQMRRYFRAECHGATEESSVDDFELMDGVIAGFGEAFATKALCGATKEDQCEG